LGQQINFFVAAPKILLQQLNVLLIEQFVVATKYFFILILTNDFVGIKQSLLYRVRVRSFTHEKWNMRWEIPLQKFTFQFLLFLT